MELVWITVGFLLGLLVMYTWLHPGWLRVLRRSEPKCQRCNKTMARPLWSLCHDCWAATAYRGLKPLDRPAQPTSPPQSAPTTGLTPGQSARLGANLAFHLRKQAQPENED